MPFILEFDMNYKRILIKLSGEVFSGNNGGNIDMETLMDIAKALKQIKNDGK